MQSTAGWFVFSTTRIVRGVWGGAAAEIELSAQRVRGPIA